MGAEEECSYFLEYSKSCRELANIAQFLCIIAVKTPNCSIWADYFISCSSAGLSEISGQT
ncbi:unknown protein [Microcystis aeruginosa NIES-843]|uniref:Uncharacterized protein n=1 Tax=Microcystis aeruginosa (strain NIES-843 / IAM M-2473) TaxID=449447 RepID=B0JT65_MICAN|nr:unknown protein [Microcystis aeruginosa NIES-843]